MKRSKFYLVAGIAAIMLIGLSIGVLHAKPCKLPEFNATDFDISADNPYLPMSVIGETYVYMAEDEDGTIINYIEFTNDTKVIMGVTCTVVHDVEYLLLEDGTYVKLEETWDWQAWDQFGNFWYFGEDTVAYEYDENWVLIGCTDEGAWEAGVDGAEPGIILPADPRQGDCSKQEYYEGEAEDIGKVLKVNETCEDLDGNESDECMEMKEWTPLDPGNIEHKTYYPGLGLVHIKELKEKTVEVDLIEINTDGVPDLDNPICP